MTPPTSSPFRNWAGNYTYRASEIRRPTSLGELQRLVANGGSLHGAGTRHSFTGIGDADTLVALDRLPGSDSIDVDRGAMTATIGAAVTYAQLAETLNRAGLALPNLASLPHISVVGAVATATHGSGDRLGNLATSVCRMRILTSSGDLVELHADDPRLAGAAVHLGALGIVVGLTLRVVPYYEVQQNVYENLEWGALFEHFDEVFALGRSVSVFHDLGSRARAVWIKSDAPSEPPSEVFGATPAGTPLHPLPDGDAANCTAQLGEAGAWSERLPHFRSGYLPSNGEEIQSEVFVARRHGVAAVRAVLDLRERIAGCLLVCELRTIAADDLWLSPHYQRDSLGLHFTWRREPATVERNVGLIEEALAEFEPRPHWGKVFSMDPRVLTPSYPRLSEFNELRAELDPRGAFINSWMRERLAI